MFWKILGVYLLLVSLLGFFLCFLDKRRAKKHAYRVAEKHFFLIALLGGGFGVWLGMYQFHHKTKHWYFVFGIPAITLIEYGLLGWVLWSYI